MGLWSTQAKVKGIMLKAAWHWSRNSRVVNDPPGEPDHTPLYIGPLLTWGSVMMTTCFPPSFMGELLTGGSNMNE